MAMPLTDYSSNRQHAVPQNIMSVEFKLVGNMTVRQFVYAATGVIGAYLIYSSGIPFIFKWPLVLVIGLGGIGFAFLPVQDRGMDIWIRNFLFAISRPTLRIWKKEPLAPAFLLSDYATALRNEVVIVAPAASRAKLMTYLGETKTAQPKNKLDIAEDLFLEHLNFNATDTTGTTVTTVTTLAPSAPVQFGRAIKIDKPDIRQPEIYLPKKMPLPVTSAPPSPGLETLQKADLTEQVVDLKKLMEKIRHKPEGVLFELPKTAGQAPIKKEEEEIPPLLSAELKKLELETKAAEAAAMARKEEEKKKQEQMAREFEEMKQTLVPPLGATPPPPIAAPVVTTTTTTAPPVAVRPVVIKPPQMGEKPKEVTEEIKTEKNITLSALPNVVNGVVKDEAGKLLQGVVVIVKDEASDPVRALKTNELGQFVISTPLPNGRYHITASQPGKRFATMEVVADGRILPPLSFSSKGNNL